MQNVLAADPEAIVSVWADPDLGFFLQWSLGCLGIGCQDETCVEKVSFC